MAARSISTAERILAVTHVSPDGDAIGSLVGLGYITAFLGKDTRLFCETPLPQHLNWLDSPSPVLSSLDGLDGWIPDLVVFLDCADDKRAGSAISLFIQSCEKKRKLQTLCIDHHLANPLFADVNWVDATMSATGVMVALLAKEFDLSLKEGLGEAICLAIISDTGSFTYANTNALALELTAEIVRNGLPMAEFTTKYENNWTLGRMQLWGELMKEIRVLCNGKVVFSVVTDEILARYNAPRTDLEGYASWLRRLANTKVVLLVRPKREGSKVSLRSMGDIDVHKIAFEFGGGGHKGAAGIDMPDQPHAAAQKVLGGICRALGEPCSQSVLLDKK